jgi:hypothetical protein
MLGAGISALIFLLQWKVFDLRSWPDTMKILGSVVLAYAVVLLGSFLWHLIRVPAELDHEKQQALGSSGSPTASPSLEGCKLTLLFVAFDLRYVGREDLGCPITLRPVVRNACSRPIGVQAIRWEPHSSIISTGIRTERIDKGLQIHKSGEWNPSWPGTDTLLVNPQDVFRAGIQTQQANSIDLARMRDAHELGRITFLVENGEMSFAI